jgi:hypothetical protein
MKYLFFCIPLLLSADLLDDYQKNPSNPEPLEKLAREYRLAGQNDLAYIFAKYGSQRFPDNYAFDEELSIVSFYTPFKEDGLTACNKIILNKNVAWPLREQTLRNLMYYVHNIKYDKLIPIEIDLPLIQGSVSEHYHPMNPSIFKTYNGYALNCRAVNYTQVGAKNFNTIDPSGHFTTKNFLVSYDKNFKLLHSKEIIDTTPRHLTPTVAVRGLEDVRLFHFDDQYWFTCNTWDTNPTGNIQISLCTLDGNTHVSDILPLNGPDPYRCEKNWLPFIKDNEIHLIYSSHPFTITKPDLITGDCETILSYEPDLNLSSFRGSAAPIAFDNGYLMLIHEVGHQLDYSRCYYHRFVYLDADFQIQKLSKPFTFIHQGVEFCLNMILDHSETKLILPIGIEDHDAYLCFIDLDTVREMLE